MVIHFLTPARPGRSRVRSITCFLFFALAFLARQSTAQTANPPDPSNPAPVAASIKVLVSGTRTSLRGLSAVSEKVIWVSGSNGTVGRSVDGGNTWTWITVPGYEKRDFRDIEAFDENTAIIMAVSDPGYILKTVNGGRNWRLVYENSTPGMFLDAMEFRNKESGIVVGDPINGRFFLAQSFDGGDNWHEIPWRELPKADTGEGCFASSGTNIRNFSKEAACFISGGLHSRIFIHDTAFDLPIIQGTTSTGANSVAVKDNNRSNGGQTLIIVGGDFTKDTVRDRNCFLTHDGARTWIRPDIPPHGYRSCVEYIGGDRLLCCGTSGVDLSVDDGMNWQWISHDSYHVCRAAKKGRAVFLAGSGGRVARLILPE